MLERCCDFYSVRQGILKSGSAFAVATPEYPDDRVEYIFEDSEAMFVITTKDIAEKRKELFSKLKCDILLLDELLENANTTNPDVDIKEHDLCYCIYTSGSTGKPKGVMIEHINLANLEWYCPNCGNRDHNTLNVARRTCGYIGSNFWNKGRTQEIKERVLHIDNKDDE